MKFKTLMLFLSAVAVLVNSARIGQLQNLNKPVNIFSQI